MLGHIFEDFFIKDPVTLLRGKGKKRSSGAKFVG
jgi:hypothetical protein